MTEIAPPSKLKIFSFPGEGRSQGIAAEAGPYDELIPPE